MDGNVKWWMLDVNLLVFAYVVHGSSCEVIGPGCSINGWECEIVGVRRTNPVAGCKTVLCWKYLIHGCKYKEVIKDVR